MFKYLIGVITRIRQGDSNSQDNPPQPHPAQSLITCFLCGWFITGMFFREIKFHEIFREIDLTEKDTLILTFSRLLAQI